MWIINPHDRPPITSQNYDKKDLRQQLAFRFQIRDAHNGVVVRGSSSVWMDPAPLWLAGLRLRGETIWYMNPNSLSYERFATHRERGL